MTSSSVLRQVALQAILREGFGKSDNDFLITFNCNFLSVMHGFRDKGLLLQAGYDVIVIFRQEALIALFKTDSERATMTS